MERCIQPRTTYACTKLEPRPLLSLRVSPADIPIKNLPARVIECQSHPDTAMERTIPLFRGS